MSCEPVMESRMSITMNRLPDHAGRWAACLAIALAPAGCTSSVNERNGLLGDVVLPAINDPSAFGNPPQNGPSTDGFDRSHWPRVTLRIPAASVEVFPTYGTPVNPPGNEESTGSGFPTPISALDIDVHAGDELASAALEPLVAAIDIAISPIRMIMQPPWTVLAEPTGGFALMPSEESDTPETALQANITTLSSTGQPHQP